MLPYREKQACADNLSVQPVRYHQGVTELSHSEAIYFLVSSISILI